MKKGILRTVEGGRLMFWCPGCECAHAVTIGEGPGPRWGFNGDYDKPTFTPSILIQTGHHVPGHKSPDCWCTYNAKNPDKPRVFECTVCHSFVTDGQIQFLSDCTHKLAGHTVPLPDFDHF